MSSSAVVDTNAEVRRLDRKAQAEDVVTSTDVKDTEKLARMLQEAKRSVAGLERRFAPKRIDFEDQAVGTAGATISLRHGFGGRVRWYVVDWDDTGGASGHDIRKDTTNTDDDTLVLASYVAGTATIRVEEAG